MSKSGPSILAASLGLATLVMLVGCSNPSSSAPPPTQTNTKSSAKAITGFWLGKEKWVGTITNGNIDVSVPSGTLVGSLTATFTTTGVSVAVGSVNQVSGVTTNDFTNPVSYVVKAEDGSTAVYQVKVTILTSSSSTGGGVTLSSISTTITLSGQVSVLAQGSDMSVTVVLSPEDSYAKISPWVDDRFIYAEWNTRKITFGSDLVVGPHTFLLQANVNGALYSKSFDFRVQ